LKKTQLLEGWEFKLLETSDLSKAEKAVSERLERGLATPEGLALVSSTMPPVGLDMNFFPATVPGSIHQDLEINGFIENPHLGLNEFRTQWIGRSSWIYRCEFLVSELSHRNDLVFHGIDTIASVKLNGVHVIDSYDMHFPYRADVTNTLTLGKNLIEVIFEAQEDWAEASEAKHGKLPNAYSDPTNQIRKMASNYGWDWGPTLVTVGLWKPVHLVQYELRFEELRVIPTVDSGVACLKVKWRSSGLEKLSRLQIWQDRDLIFESGLTSGGQVDITLPEMQLWWPRGYGEQNLYPFRFQLLDSDDRVLDEDFKIVGFRKTSILTQNDDVGEGFELQINDQRIWVRGANWIPAHTSISTVGRDLYEARIQDAIDANMNLLRVWGGGIFENNEFYEICDREGILVWQDMLFACAAYPEYESFKDLISAEVSHATERLGHHASLSVWNGSNENIWGFFDWGWKEDLAGRDWGLGLYLGLIPELLQDFDGSRPYQPSSPYSQNMDVHPNDPSFGTSHMWEPWNRQDYLTYLDFVPRFATEYGYQSPASWSTMKKAIGADQLWEDSPSMRAHQKAFDGKQKLRRSLDLRFAEPSGFKDWLFLTQLEQARALRLAVSHLRANHAVCSGSVIWQLNDCWPASSWALVDSEGVRKPSWYAVKDANQDRYVSFQGDINNLALHMTNDSQLEAVIAGSLELVSMSGDRTLIKELNQKVAANSAVSIALDLSDLKVDPSNHMMSFEFEETRTLFFFDYDRNLKYPEPEFDLKVISSGSSNLLVRLQAKSLIRDACIFPDQIHSEAKTSRSFFSLLDGDELEFMIYTDHPELFSASVLREVIKCANHYRLQ
jgi:beta-mannosidase